MRATPGPAGGYQLEPVADIPPLLLDEEEAIAIAVGLRTAAGGSITGIEETSVRALAKLEQVLPPRVRRQVNTLQTAVAPMIRSWATVDVDVLATLAQACRDCERIRFEYQTRTGDTAERHVEPHRLVTLHRRWYLVAYDRDRDDWRTFRLDRMRDVTATTWHFRAREHPDPVAYVQRSVTEAPYRYLARVRVHARPEQVRDLVPPQVGRVEDDRDGCCVLIAGGDDLEWLAVHIARLGFDAEVLDPPELRDAAARLAHRLTTMSRPPTGPNALGAAPEIDTPSEIQRPAEPNAPS